MRTCVGAVPVLVCGACGGRRCPQEMSFFHSVSLLFFETGCLTESEADSTKESGQQVPGTILPLSPQHWGFRDALPCLASSVNWGNSQLKSSMFP